MELTLKEDWIYPLPIHPWSQLNLLELYVLLAAGIVSSLEEVVIIDEFFILRKLIMFFLL